MEKRDKKYYMLWLLDIFLFLAGIFFILISIHVIPSRNGIDSGYAGVGLALIFAFLALFFAINTNKKLDKIMKKLKIKE